MGYGRYVIFSDCIIVLFRVIELLTSAILHALSFIYINNFVRVSELVFSYKSSSGCVLS